MREAAQLPAEPDSPVPGVKRPVFILGIVSFLTDVSSEMVYPLVPLFLTSTLGAPLAAVGLIEGLAESAASLFKAAGGLLSDRLRIRRPLVIAGYALSAVSLLFALGNSSDAFLLLRAKDVGLSNTEVVLSYMLFNLVYAATAMPAGIASDRLGRRNVIGLGFAVFAAVYIGFGLAGGGAAVWPLFAVYGLYMAMTEGVGRALVSDFVPSERRATALGLYQGAMGAMVLLSSVIAGVLWDAVDASAPFFLGGGAGLGGLGLLVVAVPRSPAAAGRI